MVFERTRTMTIKTCGFKSLCAILISGLLSVQAVGGQLDDFEATGKSKNSRSSESLRPHYSHGYDSYRHDSYDNFLWLFFSPLYNGRYDDSIRYDSEHGGTNEWDLIVHSPGAPVLPYVRADYNWQYLNSNLVADDVRLEAGYKCLAFHGRRTRYAEKNPTDDSDINQFYGVIRVGGEDVDESDRTNWGEVGIGIGGMQQIGNSEFSSWALTVPLKIYPAEWIGVEFHPAWYRPQDRVIGDYDLSVSLGWRFVQFRGGYRWLWVQGVGHKLNGPYAGLSVSF